MEVAVFVLMVAALLAVGLRVGMLVAPRLTRWAERDDEKEPRDD